MGIKSYNIWSEYFTIQKIIEVKSTIFRRELGYKSKNYLALILSK